MLSGALYTCTCRTVYLITVYVFIGCASADIMESETVCTQCAPAGTGRYLSPDRCVGNAPHNSNS